jgi:hypothetical protein
LQFDQRVSGQSPVLWSLTAFPVEQWDDADRYVEELIALTCDYGVARAAFAEAARRCCGALPRD